MFTDFLSKMEQFQWEDGKFVPESGLLYLTSRASKLYTSRDAQRGRVKRCYGRNQFGGLVAVWGFSNRTERPGDE